MPSPDIRAHLAALAGTSVPTITGKRNEILRVDGDRVFVKTARTRRPGGEPVEVAIIEDAAERLWHDGTIRINPDSVGYRSALLGAVLGSLPGVGMARRPARLVLETGQGQGSSPDRAHPARWWALVPGERFWLEASSREVFGRDLRAPDDRRTSHLLVSEVRAGDFVFHYSTRRHAIIGWSVVSREARRAGGEYRATLGGLLGMMDVSLARVQEFDRPVRKVGAEMERLGYDMRGFPFERSAERPIRPLPAYLAKMPRAIVKAIPDLAEAAAFSANALTSSFEDTSQATIGGDYQRANEGVVIPFIGSVETAAWRAEKAARRTERSTREHNRLQNRLERYLRERGIRTLSPLGEDVPFDLAWRAGGVLAFAEVKSVSAGHESQRLRLGLGQCLFYRHALQERMKENVASFLAVPQEPQDPAWLGACAAAGVRLIWPTRFAGAAKLDGAVRASPERGPGRVGGRAAIGLVRGQ